MTTMMTKPSISRRNVLKAGAATAATSAVGSFTFGFHIPALAQGASPEVNAWVVVKPDETVVIRIARSEMGQGTLTGLAQLVAEELQCDWGRVTTEYPTPGQNLARARVWGNFSTGGSRGIRESQEYVRKGGAAARMVLVQAAAQGWNVPADQCTVSKGTITHAASNRSTTYGKVAAVAATLQAPAAANVPLKDPKTWTIAGKPLRRLDTAEKTNGSLKYAMDINMPGMLNASVKRCPVFGGKVKSFDRASAMAKPGVKRVVQIGDNTVAVVADTWWRAHSALQSMKIEWDNGPNASASSAAFANTLKTALDANDAVAGTEIGNAKDVLSKATRKIEATYSYPHHNHACMETMNATAVWTADKCEVWTATQNGEAALAATSEAAGLPQAKCDVYKMPLGGGFGRRGAVHDYVTQAVAIAKEMPGTPVKVIWSREEDMLHGRFHPATMAKMTAAIDANGNIEAVHMRIAGQSILSGLLPQNIRNGLDPVVFQGLNASGPEGSLGYSIPNFLADHAMRNPSTPVGFWRGVNLNQNAIYLECFMDEIAHATKQDPLEMRRKLMGKHPKHLAVLDAVAKKAAEKPLAAGVHRGYAQIMGFGSYVAAAADVSVARDGKVKVHRIVASTDPGHAVNPQQIEAQVEGSFVYGLSALLYQECTVKDGKMEQENFHTYPPIRLDEMPKVETVIISSGGFWGGVGEPTIAVAAPAVLNAIFLATGKRIRHSPIKDQLKA